MKARFLALASLACVASEADAQTPPRPAAPGPAGSAQAAAPPPATARPGAPSVSGVTVTAPGEGTQTSIDRRSYSVAGDLQATHGSIADALRNVPSVDVDVNGAVSLRGSSGVTILIDGKPSGMMRGEGRGDILQQLPASQIERIEVMTNPSAAFSPEGGAGIINLVTKQSRGLGPSGSVRARASDRGRQNLGLSAAYNDRKLTLAGDLGLQNGGIKGQATDHRVTLGPAGETRRSQDADIRALSHGWNGRGSIDYDPTKADRLNAEATFFGSNSRSLSATRYDQSGGGLPDQRSERFSDGDNEFSMLSAKTGWRRKFAGEEHELSASLGFDVTDSTYDFLSDVRDSLPVVAGRYETGVGETLSKQWNLKADYKRPLDGSARLELGYDLTANDDDNDAVGLRGATLATLANDANRTNHLLFDQAVHAAYATYQRPFGDLTVKGGLRFETTESDVHQLVGNLRGGADYNRFYPSLHLAYKLDDRRQLTASYSRRIVRPRSPDLNPFVVKADDFNLRAGNPNLEPAVTHSWETGYQLRRTTGAFYLATAFYRQTEDGFTDVVRDLGGGVLLSTRDNIGESRAGGLELVASGRLTPKLTYNLSGMAAWNEIDAASLGFSGVRSASSLSGRGNINWQVTAKDLVQLSGSMQGKRLTAQGYIEPSGMLNFGYRHKVNERLYLTVTGQDLLDSMDARTVVDTPNLKRKTVTALNQRGVFIGFSYALGVRRPQQREPGFEFDTGGGAGVAGP